MGSQLSERLSYCDRKFVYVAFAFTTQNPERTQPKYKPVVRYRKIPKEIFYAQAYPA